MALFLALDVGGTKTDYLLADEGRVLARVRSGSIKRMRSSAESATGFLEGALAELTQQTGVALQTVKRTCIGTAGNTVPLVTDWLAAEVGRRVGGELLILGDVDIALDAAFPGQPGVLALAGTGSNVAGRADADQILTVGGWGPALSDQGSGHRIGEQALRAVALAHDRGEDSALLREVLAHWGAEGFEGFVDHANRHPAPDASQLVPLIVHCAEQGDPVAQQVLREQGEELGSLVCLLISRLRRHSGKPDFVPELAFAGSILERVPAVRSALVDHVCQAFPAVRVQGGVVDPIAGALWRARSGAGFGAAKAGEK